MVGDAVEREVEVTHPVVAVSGDESLRREVTWLERAAGHEVPVFSGAAQGLLALKPGGTMLLGADQVASSFDSEKAAAAGARVVRVALAAARPAAEAAVFALPRDGEAILRLLDQATRDPSGAFVLGVLGARGGIGATALSAACAREARRAGSRTALVDLDRYGGGIDVMLGIEHAPGMRWPEVATQGGSPHEMVLPRWQQVAVLSAGGPADSHLGGPDAGYVRGAIERIRREADLVVIDIAAGWGAAGVDRVAGWCDAVVLLAGLDLASVAGGLARLEAMGGTTASLAVRLPGSGRLTVSELGDALGLPPRARVRTERGLAADLEHGGTPADRPRRALARSARAVLREVGLPAPGDHARRAGTW